MGNRSTITQYTVLIPSEVRASNIQDNIRFSRELCTKYNPIVTAPATTKLNTVKKGIRRLNTVSHGEMCKIKNKEFYLKRILHPNGEHIKATKNWSEYMPIQLLLYVYKHYCRLVHHKIHQCMFCGNEMSKGISFETKDKLPNTRRQ